MEWNAVSFSPDMLLVPFSHDTFVLRSDAHALYMVRLDKVEPFFIACYRKDLQLNWIPVFRIDLLQVRFSKREYLGVHASANFTYENTVIQFKVGSLVAHAINTVSIELILGHSLLQ